MAEAIIDTQVKTEPFFYEDIRIVMLIYMNICIPEKEPSIDPRSISWLYNDVRFVMMRKYYQHTQHISRQLKTIPKELREKIQETQQLGLYIVLKLKEKSNGLLNIFASIDLEPYGFKCELVFERLIVEVDELKVLPTTSKTYKKRYTIKYDTDQTVLNQNSVTFFISHTSSVIKYLLFLITTKTQKI